MESSSLTRTVSNQDPMRSDPAMLTIDPPSTDAPSLVGRLAPERLIDLWHKVTSGVVKYGFAIEYRDLEPPRIGIFDGLRITIDPGVGFEMQCFILLHLFGHSVQWVAPSLESQLDALQIHRRSRPLHGGLCTPTSSRPPASACNCCTRWA